MKAWTRRDLLKLGLVASVGTAGTKAVRSLPGNAEKAKTSADALVPSVASDQAETSSAGSFSSARERP